MAAFYSRTEPYLRDLKQRSGCATRPDERAGVLQAAIPAGGAEVPFVLHAV
ncbi:hypothetical protein ACWGH3_02820 [Streptomyces sp. NPDC054884]|uniref:hypothetical protein n=1 Tax=Streptomyces sp. ME08-AFT2 TaxID=3028683 RepID=UPI0029BB7FC9|nr:hypothetical protein [Streptomyces sp. ME08-AFT2]MDX3310615.1 hypothetical protein [Streptomyces sp. ME08-AFT2]